ncbi:MULTISPECIES: ABC transporter ATP-binding protein [Thauera]|mgnify:FL=1|uniref:ABC transporter ATP-binding protein n=1 Tax=Thauera aminoaromatica TaxID=164330 RepID=C4ZN20_THASP|nr:MULTISPECIES: ABC transporter ATP-binding protein [Thauera]MBL8463166.1 ABC transporter ATP-binding protein [Thauera sp.]MDA0234450.1 ABC transporter ATP-binding protein [Pseudomonadota bacterium]OPZ04407.1 MAG: putative ABC transporter ATP-binding protein YbhF [Alphaproteobacteria bacterium ADurb.BinA305]ACK53432.1 ABC transporter related [Thauera aminoaromatica]MCK6396968.1 ABC transporter ATP-binding protein [Thauera aminoaromatica]
MADISPAQNDPGAPVIVARGVRKHYGPIHAVDGVDLEVRSGELFGLIGHNGAGKSTMFKMMLGLIPLTAGEIRIDGAPVPGSDFRTVRRKVGYLPENVVLYDNLTGTETLDFFARLKGVSTANNAAVLERVGLMHAAKRRVREYSKGMRQRLGFAQALLGKPRILFLDEPTTGLDPEAIRGFYAILRQLKSEGVTMVITSHILAEIQERVDRLAIMAAGKVQATGTVQALREQMDLPLWFDVRVAPEDFEAVRNALGGLPVGAIEARDGHVAVQCARDAKMAVIAALATLNGKVRDLTVREPSLEDVFFGFSD